ncbi:SDR family NAD(P)-dependent oxidoreductase [Kitasatospora aureofaciens]|uniref:type I polyketide synthase n=1 Tax=Kitasatospora aureofaciens TaxID=1894 RepID=UPI001C45F084|nr:type I polyketide synthase [Kitasatospora aureofaciens]MBV6699437.1 SDR family NAD(P)-dependent oxidoreductase [Kitasatospora aureofaciens]
MSEEKLRYFLKRVTANLHETRHRLQELEAASGEPIAIVGMSCRFPGGVRSPEALWELLDARRESVAGLPQDRGWAVGDPDDPESGAEVQAGNFVYDATQFDAGFFGISPREALSMDPQQRLLLEVSWEALEQAGIDPATLRGSATGVFAGASASGYGWITGKQGELDGHVMTGNATSILSGRVSYTLGLEGPAVTVDTACSSSLVSLHLAAQALRSGECTMALVGGAFVAATPVLFTDFSRSLGLSPDGRCKTFGAGADGMGVAEGAGVVVVERLSDARRNGHQVLAVVRGSAINQDGASNGLTAPNGPSQQRVIRAALASARLSTADVDVVEAHGTGTPLGDPIEAQALLATYGQNRPEGQPLWLGSVKSNIGHTQQAAGMAGIIKMVLALRNEQLPATLHVAEPTPEVDWSAGDVELLADPVPWPSGERVRRAGVSAFGMSGTNVHIILEEAPTGDPETAEASAEDGDEAEVLDEPAEVEAAAPAVVELDGLAAWAVSGRSAQGLTAQAGRLREWVGARPELTPTDVAWSLAATRSAFEHRAVVVGGERGELVSGLESLTDGVSAGSVVSGVARSGGRTAFVFAGQGAQWVGMGRELALSSPVFAARLAECERALAPHVPWSLSEVLAGAEGAPGLDSADVVQPVLWAVMVSLAAVWEAAGVTPDAVIGHSQGEIAAATVAGMLSLEDGARVVAVRARALTSLDVQGSMVSVVMPSQAVREIVEGWGERLSVAAINGPAAVVVSGEPEALSEFERELASRKVLRWRIPATDFVAHSPAVEPLAAVLAEELAGITPRTGRVPMISTVTGEWLSGTEVDAAYWFANLRRMVRFEEAVRILLGGGYGAFVEVSPHPVLTASVTETAEDAGIAEVLTVGTLERDNAGASRLITSLAQAYVGGLSVDWKTVLPAAEQVELPTYAFQQQRYWLEPSAASVTPAGGDGASTAAEARFWAAVEGGDLAHIAEVLELDDQRSLGDVLEALTSWRRRERDRSATADWRYRVTWAPVADPGSAALAGRWLVLADQAEDDLTQACVQALTARGADVTVAEVRAGAADRSDVAAVIGRALQDAEAPAGVVSLLALDETPVPEYPAVPQGFAATLAVVQALGDAEIDAPLWVLTRGAVAATPGEELTNPLQTQIWGFGRVVGLEHPDRWGGVIDLPADFDEQVAARLCAVLAGCGEDQVAIRPTAIFGRRLTRAGQPRANSEQWTPSGSVLVTGGTGAIGGHVARWLAGRGAQRLVLTSRSGAAAAGLAATVAELAARGSRVDVVACDAADRSDLAGVLDWLATDGPALSAVMHTAGVVQHSTVHETDLAETAAVLAAKAAGAVHLDELTRDMDLDAFVLFSSIAATWGSGLQPAYAAANTFLDGLAEYRRAQGRTATSVAWGSWGGGGMTDEDGAAQGLRRGLIVMDKDRAVQALAQILDGGEAQLTVADIDWARFAPPFTLRRPSPLIENLPEVRQALAGDRPDGAGGDAAGSTDASASWKQQLAGLPRIEQNRMLVSLVQTQAAAVLDYPSPEAVEATRAFSDLGFDSLTSVELRNRLSAATGLQLPATLMFDAPNPTAAAEFLLALLAGVPDGAQTAPVVAAASDEPLAIVGMACRYPGGVTGPEELWDLVTSGTDAISVLPEDRGWVIEDRTDATEGGPVRAGGFVYDATGFDAGFFGISPREAVSMDPQQRLLLEVAWEALERAGLDPASLRGSATGVFAGASASGYGWSSGLQGELDGHLVTGISTSVVSGRVSYVLGLEGPAVTVDTACSSSLVALHLAAQAVRSGECTLALAGGVMVAANPLLFDQFSRQMGLAPDGRCKPFSEAADGMGLGEGAGMLVVERLSDAQRNGHKVLAVIRGSATNQDGASNGLTAPNGPSQQRVIRAALANAGVRADEVDVVEAHGTGTPLGDPIEAQALLATYGQERAEDRPLWLGSVKSNIGHTQAAAGVAGVIKMVLALQHKQLPKTLHAAERSPHIDWSAGDVELLTEAMPWSAEDRVRRAGVSSFGMSGTNAHLILEEAPVGDAVVLDEPGDDVESAAVPLVVEGGEVSAWLVSGRSAQGLTAQAGRLREWVGARPELTPADVAWSLAATRSAFEHRAVVVGGERGELVSGLESLAAGTRVASVVSGVARTGGRTAFVFAGQGSQWVGMGRELAQSSPVFAARLAECERALAPHVPWKLSDVLAGAEGAPGLDTADVVQPVLWAVMVSLAAVWEAAGVAPDAVVGHSQGEIAAATVAGMLSLEDGARVVAVRARALTSLDVQGSMVSVVMPSPAVREIVEGWGERLSVAAINGPAAVVVSGQPDALSEFERELASRKVLRWRVPETDFVAHSPAVEPLAAVLEKELAGITPQAGRVPMVSTVTGEWLTGTEVDAGYWYANLRRMVRFEEAVRTLTSSGYGAFVEVSPHPVLTASVTETAEDAGIDVVSVGSLERDNGGAGRLITSLAQAYVGGLSVDWQTVLPAAEPVDLPTYAFQHQHYWLQAAATASPVGGDGASTAAEAQFWAAVEGGDLARIADTLAIEDQKQLSAVLPALASWRRREQDRSVTENWRYRVTWAPVADPAPARLSGQWLVVLPAGRADGDLAQQCTAALTARGAELVVMETTAAAGRERMAEQIRAVLPEAGFAGVVSLLALDETPVPEYPVVPQGLAATLALVQALGAAEVGAPLWVATSGAVAGGPGKGPTGPVQTQMWGLGRVVALEHPDRWGGLIDLPETVDEQAAGRLAAVLAGCGEDQVAIRPAGILARRLTRAPHPRTAGQAWTPGGTVLVTGGTGAIGGHVARWLAGRGAQRLVLTSRSGPAAAGLAATVAELAARGSRVDVVACDASDRADLAGALDWIGTTGPALSTVMHTAGIGQATTVQDTDLAETAAVLAAKAAGAVHLDELTRDMDLDAFVLFSSISATWGSSVQPAYAAANTFLDGLAECRTAQGLPATSVAWGPWGGGGMTDSDTAAWMARGGLMVMDEDHAVQALAQILDGREGSVTIADVDWARFAPPFTLRRRSPLIEGLPEVVAALAGDGAGPAADPDAGASLTQQLAGLSRAEQNRTLVKLVQAKAAAVLDYASPEAVEATRAFSDLGFDSLTSVELRNRLSTATGLQLPATLLFDCPTPVALAEYLWNEAFQDGSGPVSLVEEVDRLGSLLTEAMPDEKTYQLINDRLQGLLSQWKEAGASTEGQAVAEKIGSATDDEIFEFIHKELGR